MGVGVWGRVSRGGVGEPHSLGIAIESGAKICDPPANLGVFVSLVSQRHDDVIVDLGDRVAVTVEALTAFAIGLQNPLVDFRVVALQPAHQGRPDVEAHILVVVNDPRNFAAIVKYAGKGVRAVAFDVNAFVPVVGGGGAGAAVERVGG